MGRGIISRDAYASRCCGAGATTPGGAQGGGVVMMDVLLTQLPLIYQIVETRRLRHADQRQPAAGYQQKGGGSARGTQLLTVSIRVLSPRMR
jgi:hypothetical protein